MIIQAAGAGIEPTSRRSERPVLPLDEPAEFPRAEDTRRGEMFATEPNQARGEGIEPPSPGSKPGGLPLADPRSPNDGVRG